MPKKKLCWVQKLPSVTAKCPECKHLVWVFTEWRVMETKVVKIGRDRPKKGVCSTVPIPPVTFQCPNCKTALWLTESFVASKVRAFKVLEAKIMTEDSTTDTAQDTSTDTTTGGQP